MSNYLGQKLSKLIEESGLSPYMVARKADIDTGQLYKILDGRLGASVSMVEKLSSVPDLNVDKQTLAAWRIIDISTPEIIAQAYEELQLERAQRELDEK